MAQISTEAVSLFRLKANFQEKKISFQEFADLELLKMVYRESPVPTDFWGNRRAVGSEIRGNRTVF